MINLDGNHLLHASKKQLYLVFVPMYTICIFVFALYLVFVVPILLYLYICICIVFGICSTNTFVSVYFYLHCILCSACFLSLRGMVITARLMLCKSQHNFKVFFIKRRERHILKYMRFEQTSTKCSLE